MFIATDACTTITIDTSNPELDWLKGTFIMDPTLIADGRLPAVALIADRQLPAVTVVAPGGGAGWGEGRLKRRLLSHPFT